MANIWNAMNEITRIIESRKARFHEHLRDTTIWALCTDAKHVTGNRLNKIKVAKTTNTERLNVNSAFKFTIFMGWWTEATDDQRLVAIDEALARCGVKYEPQKVVINGKEQTAKDNWGRTLYTKAIAYDEDGNPKWRVNKPDAEVFFELVQRHGAYTPEVANVQRALNGEELWFEDYDPNQMKFADLANDEADAIDDAA